MQLFDSLVHVGNNVKWPKYEKKIDIDDILNEYEKNKFIKGALLQDSPWYETRNDWTRIYNKINKKVYKKEYYMCVSIPRFLDQNEIKRYIDECIKKGIRIFKIHPRFSVMKEEDVLGIIKYMLAKRVGIQLCTYGFESGFIYLNSMVFMEKLIELCEGKRKGSLMLMHLGGTECLKYHNFVRHSDVLIGDLSMTILKYKGSSVDLDIHYLIENFDRRTVIGTDYPEGNVEKILERLRDLEKKLGGWSDNKIQNVLMNNTQSFCRQSYEVQ